MTLHLEGWLFAKPCHAQSSLLPIYHIQGGLGPLQDFTAHAAAGAVDRLL